MFTLTCFCFCMRLCVQYSSPSIDLAHQTDIASTCSLGSQTPRFWTQLASFVLFSAARCSAQEEHIADTYLVEPPNWERTDNWRPPANPGNTFYWHDKSWAPECPWDIGRLTKLSLEAPVRIQTRSLVVILQFTCVSSLADAWTQLCVI